MNNIRIIPKPDSVSYDDICAVLDEIHAGESFDYNTSGLTGEQIAQRVGETGAMLVAMDGDTVVGTIAVCVEPVSRWYYRGDAGRIRFMGVLPSCRGQHVGTRLIEAGLQFALERGLGAVVFATAAVNHKAIAMYRRAGCRYVDFMHYKNLGHYSVMGLYPLDGNAPSEAVCRIRFALKKAYVRLRYTPNGDRRLI